MEKMKINAYLDFELTRKLEALVINSLPEQSYQSDFNMVYIANVDVHDNDDGTQTQTAVECDDTFFISIVNDFNNIDYRMVKIVHAADVYESDYEVMEYYPASGNMHMFSNYHAGNPIPSGGGMLNVAFSPFGVNKIEMINGQVLHLYGNGVVPVTTDMIGLKGYKQIPKVTKILSNDTFKIIKLALYTRYQEYTHRKYAINIFSPTMRIFEEEIQGQFSLDEERMTLYIRDKYVKDNEGNYVGLEDLKNNVVIPAEVLPGIKSNLTGIDNIISINRHGFIDASSAGPSLINDFSVHTISLIKEFAPRGTIIFEMGYGITPSGYQTHHITLFAKEDGSLCYNGQYSDEWINTGYILSKNMENLITFTLENQKFDEADQNENVVFIHVNGKQIWPSKPMYTKTEKIYIWRAMEAYRTYTEVCMKLPAPHPVNGGLDAKTVCAKKLLQESGFITTENLVSAYELYLNRPRPSAADPKDIMFGSEENMTIKKVFFGQDSEKDIFDEEYCLDGGFSEIILFSPSLERNEIEDMHLLNILKTTTVKI